MLPFKHLKYVIILSVSIVSLVTGVFKSEYVSSYGAVITQHVL